MTENVTNRQLFFIVFLRIIAGSILELPLIMAQKVGTGAWLVLLIASILTCIPIAIIVYLGTKFQDKTLFEYSQLLVGKFFTYLFVSIYILYYFSVIVLLTRSTADIIKTEFLIKTPVYATMILILLVTGYAASKKLTNLGRLFEFLGIIIIIISFMLHMIMFFQGDIRNIKPFFEMSEIKTYFSELPTTVFIFIGFESITIIPFSKLNGKKAIWISILSVLAVGIIFIYVTETSFMILGLEDVVNYKYPDIAAIRRLDLPYLQFFKRFDLIFINIWIFSLFCALSFVIFTVTQYTKKVFTKFKFNLILIVVCVSAFMLGLIPKSSEDVSKVFIFITSYIGLIPAIIIPLILFIVAKVKKNAQ